jgi:hypothetical protein
MIHLTDRDVITQGTIENYISDPDRQQVVKNGFYQLDRVLRKRGRGLVVSFYGSTEKLIGINECEKERNLEICKALGTGLQQFGDNILLLTGGTDDVSKISEESYGIEDQIVRISPDDYSENEKERRVIIAGQTKVAILISGGPGSAEEAAIAYQSGALVIPITSTGGAAGGNYLIPFPERSEIIKHLLNSGHISSKNWKRLKDPKTETAQISRIIMGIISSCLDD